MPDTKKLREIILQAYGVIYPNPEDAVTSINNFNENVPLFIQEASTKSSYENWKKEVCEEFLENKCNCVSYLNKCYFSQQQLERIKNNWSKISEKLRGMALQPDQKLDAAFYSDFEDTLIKITKQSEKNLGRRTAIHRLVASLQPYVFSAVSSERFVVFGLKYLKQHYDSGIKSTGNWYKDSPTLLKLVYEAFPEAITPEQKRRLAIYQWAICKYADPERQ